jgi:hypothetical protein
MTIAISESTITVVFVHGLWLLPSSWDRWVSFFEEAGYVAVAPGWPDDPETVAQAREHPEVFAGKGITEIADYEEAIKLEVQHETRRRWPAARRAVQRVDRRRAAWPGARSTQDLRGDATR